MAFSTTGDHLQTGTEIMTEALELVGALEAGGTISTADQTSTLRTLNNLLKFWAADIQLYSQGEYTLDLTASDGTYLLDDSNVGYFPTKVLYANLVDSAGEETPLTEVTTEEWYALNNKTTEGTPTQFWQKREAAGVGLTFYLWPEPLDTTYDAKLWLQYPVRDVDAVGDDVWVPQEWFLPLSYALAATIAPKWGLHILERKQFWNMADDLREEARSFDTDGSLYLQPESSHG